MTIDSLIRILKSYPRESEVYLGNNKLDAIGDYDIRTNSIKLYPDLGNSETKQ